jgi:hypothetical protein
MEAQRVTDDPPVEAVGALSPSADGEQILLLEARLLGSAVVPLVAEAVERVVELRLLGANSWARTPTSGRHDEAPEVDYPCSGAAGMCTSARHSTPPTSDSSHSLTFASIAKSMNWAMVWPNTSTWISA